MCLKKRIVVVLWRFDSTAGIKEERRKTGCTSKKDGEPFTEHVEGEMGTLRRGARGVGGERDQRAPWSRTCIREAKINNN